MFKKGKAYFRKPLTLFAGKLFWSICQDQVERQEKAPGRSIKGLKVSFEVFINHKACS